MITFFGASHVLFVISLYLLICFVILNSMFIYLFIYFYFGIYIVFEFTHVNLAAELIQSDPHIADSFIYCIVYLIMLMTDFVIGRGERKLSHILLH